MERRHLRAVACSQDLLESEPALYMHQALVGLMALEAILPSDDCLRTGLAALIQALGWRLGVPAA